MKASFDKILCVNKYFFSYKHKISLEFNSLNIWKKCSIYPYIWHDSP
jgi:hypothetical protein